MPGWIANETLQRVWRKILEPVASALSKRVAGPDTITMAGFPVMALAGLAYAFGMLFWAALFIFIAGMLDILDGQVARMIRPTAGGAFLDSTLDRWGELLLYLGLAYLFRDSWLLYVVILGLGGAFLSSYARARAEGLGDKCREGAFQRPERLIVLGSASIINYLINIEMKNDTLLVLQAGVVIVAVFSLLTAVQRTTAVYKRLRHTDIPQK